MGDPFLINGPAVISFSGGRTSGYMLWRILQAHGGTLPGSVSVAFTNTGREMPATLDFVNDCATRWGVHVTWLEFTETAPHFEVVSHNSASRAGEPFEALIRHRGGLLPNPVARFCTIDLKIRPTMRWMDAMGFPASTRRVIGFRADEPMRVERALDPDRQKKAGREGRNQLFPLYDVGVTKADVLAFWRAQPFDLRLAGAWEGNCDGCMLKRRSAIARMTHDHPERMRWWAEQEAIAAGRIGSGRGALFRGGWRDGYAGISRDVRASPLLPGLEPDDDGADVFLPCDTECGA